MAYDKEIELIRRIRQELDPYNDRLQEKKMFGGLCFLLHGKIFPDQKLPG
jgi:hypothetical protein